MKKIVYATTFLVATALLMSACKWFKKQPSAQFSGKWTVDTMYYAGKDSNSLAPLVIGLAKKELEADSIAIQFNTDSTCTFFSGTEKNKGYYHYNKDSIYVQEAKTSTAYHFIFRNDTSLQLQTKDSVVLLMHKQ